MIKLILKPALINYFQKIAKILPAKLLIIQDFNLQRQMRPDLGKAVGHLVLSWSKEDLLKLSDDIMVERAKEYMDKVGIYNTQYVVVRHSDVNIHTCT
ncbi:MAG: Relaxase [Mucilaginibacter sp.]|nr:Relaxase [Mucilaginibacter sp.]